MNTSTNTIKELYEFQKAYLLKIINDIPNEKLYLNHEKGINSPGWVLGHLVVEVQDISDELDIEIAPISNDWLVRFQEGRPWVKISNEELPSKEELISLFELRYDTLIDAYVTLKKETRQGPQPSKFVSDIYSNLDSWFAHHMITHLSVHTGNIATWKQINGI